MQQGPGHFFPWGVEFMAVQGPEWIILGVLWADDNLQTGAAPSPAPATTSAEALAWLYLGAGDGDPLQPVLAHQVLEGQLQLHLGLPRAAPCWAVGCGYL